MNDPDIRRVLELRLRGEHQGCADVEMIHEFCLHGRVHCVDLAVITDRMHGYEIKSARDTLRRLPAQAYAYGEVFEQATLVVAAKHHGAAVRLIPEWWGVIVAARPEGQHVQLQEGRRHGLNPQVDRNAVAALLWREQALGLLEARGLSRGLRTATRARLCAALAYHLPLPELKAEVRTAVRRQRVIAGSSRTSAPHAGGNTVS